MLLGEVIQLDITNLANSFQQLIGVRDVNMWARPQNPPLFRGKQKQLMCLPISKSASLEDYSVEINLQPSGCS